MTGKPKVALVCTEMLPVPPISGGAIQTYIAGVLPALQRRFDITVVGVQHPNLPEQERRDGVRYVRIPRGEGRPDYYRGVAAFLTTERWDLVEVFNRPVFVEPLAEAAPGARMMLSVHNDMFRPNKIGVTEADRCLDITSVCVTISRFIARRIAEAYPRHQSKLVPIYSGVDTQEFRPRWKYTAEEIRAARPHIPGFDAGPVILTVGRLSEKKGPHHLVRAMEQVLETHPKAKMIIAGSRWYGKNQIDPYVEKLHRMAEPLGEAIHFTGYVTYDTIASYFLWGDLFVCASQWEEPLARVHYEAMAAGLPILTTQRGGNAEVMEEGKNGFVLRAYDDPTAFAEHIRRLLDNPDLRNEMGRRGRWLARHRYTWSRVASDLERAMVRALESPLSRFKRSKSTPQQKERELIALAMEVSSEYPMNFLGYEVVSNRSGKMAWLLKSKDRQTLLEEFDGSKTRREFLARSTRELIARGVRIPALLKTRDKEYFVRRKQGIFALSESPEGRLPALDEDADRRAVMRALATFHRASIGLEIPEGSEVKTHLGRELDSFRSRLRKLEVWHQEARANVDRSIFEEVYLSEGASLLEQARQAIEALDSPEYKTWVAEAEQQPTLTHNDFLRNTRLTDDGQCWVFSLRTASLSLPTRDILKVLQQLMTDGWTLDTLRRCLGFYGEVQPWTEPRQQVLIALASFPDHGYRLVSRNFKRLAAVGSVASTGEELRAAIRFESETRTVLEACSHAGLVMPVETPQATVLQMHR